MKKNNNMLIGTSGNVDTIEKKAWRVPLFAGIGIVLLYLAYDTYNLSFNFASDITVYIDYPLEEDFRFVTGTVLATVACIVLMVIILIIIMLLASRMHNTIIWLYVSVLSLLGTIVISGILCSLRIIVDLNVLAASPDPVTAWIYRYYDGMTLVAELKVIPDILMNGALLFGIVLVGVSVLDYSAKIRSYIDVMSRGFKSSDEFITIDGKKHALKCKELNGIKACEFK